MRQELNGRITPGLGAAIFTLFVLLLSYGFTPGFTTAVGERDGLVFHNFHGIETNGGITYRWSNGNSQIELPQIGQSGSAVIRLGLLMVAVGSPVRTTVMSGDEPILVLPLQRGDVRSVLLLVPRFTAPLGSIRLDLRSPTWHASGDKRDLGIGVRFVGWRSLGWTLPPWGQLAVLPALTIGIALLLSRLRLGPVAAASGGALVGMTLAALAGLRPLEVAPYTPWLLLMILLVHAGLLLWSAVAGDGWGEWRFPARIQATGLVLLSGIGYWMMMLYQWVLGSVTSPTVLPRIGTMVIGAATLLLLLGVATLRPLGPDRQRRAALALLGVSGVAEGIYAAAYAFTRSGPDFFILWRAAYDFHLGRPLYKLQDVLTNHFGAVYKVPPFYGMLFLPFATADDNLVLLGHRIMNVVLYVVVAAILAGLLRRRMGWQLALGAVTTTMGLIQAPFDTIAYGQIDVVLLLLLTLALLGLRQQRSWLVGLGIAMGGLFKLYPMVLVGFLLVRREWKSLGWTALWLAVLNGVAIGVMGWQNHVIYVTKVLPNISGGTSWLENQTINGFLSRLIIGTVASVPEHNRLVDLLTYCGFAVITGLSLGLAAAPSDRRSSQYALQYSLFAVVMVLAVPAAWMHYSTITVLTFVTLVWYATDRPPTLRRAFGIAVAFSLIGYGNQWSFFGQITSPGLPALSQSYKFYGLALLWSMIAVDLWHLWIGRRPWEWGRDREMTSERVEVQALGQARPTSAGALLTHPGTRTG